MKNEMSQLPVRQNPQKRSLSAEEGTLDTSFKSVKPPDEVSRKTITAKNAIANSSFDIQREDTYY